MVSSAGLRQGVQRRAVLAMLAMLPLAACGGGAPLPTFDLTAPRDAARGAGRTLIVVTEPSTLAAFDSNRIVSRAHSGEIAYLGGAQWADRLPKLFQVRLIQTFENRGRIASVGRPGDRLVPAAQINSELRQFGIDEASGEAVVEISVKIVDDRSGRIRAGAVFLARHAAGAVYGPSAAAALDLAAQDAMRQITTWVSSRV